MAYRSITREGDAPPATPPTTPTTPTVTLGEKVETTVQTLQNRKDENTSTLATQYDKIITANFNESNSPIVDIITQYYWCQNKPIEIQGEMVTNVPFLYAIEYKQRYGVTLTNLINNLYGMVNTGSDISSNVISGLGAILSKVSDTIVGSLDKDANGAVKGFITDGVNKFGEALSSFSSKVGNSLAESGTYGGNIHLKTNLLKPYCFLYSLQQTGKKFCFPFFGDNAAAWVANNSFSSDGSVSILSKFVSEGIAKLGNGVAKIAGDIQDISNFLKDANAQKGFTMYNIEKAKAFSFPTDGKKISVSFPLYNTIKKGEWEKNYKFIVLFGLRNMLFRINNVQYYQPMIYDVSTPGFGRMPLCYVSSYTVKPVGMTRVKSVDMGFLNGESGDNKLSTVIVPEAWIVQIEFQSLIADSANQYLSSIFDLPITANIVNY